MKIMKLSKNRQIIFPIFQHPSEACCSVFSDVIIYFMFPWTSNLYEGTCRICIKKLLVNEHENSLIRHENLLQAESVWP